MADRDFSPADFVEQQLEATRATWALLRKHGVSDGSELQLDFFYATATNARAAELGHFLEQETDYKLRVVADRDQWILRGHTQPTPVSLAMVEQWVEWMIAAGLRFECAFDGWGAEAQ